MSRKPLSAAGILRDAGLSALVAFGLFVALIGLHLVPTDTGLELQTRPLALAAVVGAVFVGRILMLCWRLWRPAGAPTPRLLAEGITRAGRLVAPVFLILALTLPLYGGRYALDTGILVLTYVMLGWGLSIVVGLAGLLDLGYVAFYAVGAYSYALLSTTFNLGFWTTLPIAGMYLAPRVRTACGSSGSVLASRLGPALKFSTARRPKKASSAKIATAPNLGLGCRTPSTSDSARSRMIGVQSSTVRTAAITASLRREARAAPSFAGEIADIWDIAAIVTLSRFQAGRECRRA